MDEDDQVIGEVPPLCAPDTFEEHWLRPRVVRDGMLIDLSCVSGPAAACGGREHCMWTDTAQGLFYADYLRGYDGSERTFTVGRVALSYDDWGNMRWRYADQNTPTSCANPTRQVVR